MTLRLLAGAIVAVLIAVLARRVTALTSGGAAAAVVVGTCAVAAGWTWGALLVLYFTTSVGWSRWRATLKDGRTASVVAKAGARDAAQVLANGAAFAAAAALLAISDASGYLDTMTPAISAATLGALCAAGADTWATEIGVGSSAAPRSLVTGRLVPPGLSGGVTGPGTIGGAGGALVLGIAAVWMSVDSRVAAAGVAGGIAGMFADSALGATLQTRRWCDACNVATERDTHSCGAATSHAGGLAWLNNDWVNALSTCGGAGLAAALAQ